MGPWTKGSLKVAHKEVVWMSMGHQGMITSQEINTGRHLVSYVLRVQNEGSTIGNT